MNIKYMKAISYAERVRYIKQRIEFGLTSDEMMMTIPTEQFVELAEAYIELIKQTQPKSG